MVKKVIDIGGKKVTFRASALVPRLYRHQFRRDILKDMMKLAETVDENDEEASSIPMEDLEVFENVAYMMARHGGDEDVPDTIEEWLDQFDFFGIFEVLPVILELWNINMHQMEEAKKKGVPPKG